MGQRLPCLRLASTYNNGQHTLMIAESYEGQNLETLLTDEFVAFSPCALVYFVLIFQVPPVTRVKAPDRPAIICGLVEAHLTSSVTNIYMLIQSKRAFLNQSHVYTATSKIVSVSTVVHCLTSFLLVQTGGMPTSIYCR